MRNRTVETSTSKIPSKHEQLTFKYFSDKLLCSIGIEHFDKNMNIFQIYIKNNINNIFSFFNAKFCKFNLSHKDFSWMKSLKRCWWTHGLNGLKILNLKKNGLTRESTIKI